MNGILSHAVVSPFNEQTQESKSLSHLLLPLGPMLSQNERKCPVTVSPSSDSSWAGPSCSHRTALPSPDCITEKWKPWGNLSWFLQIVITPKSETNHLLSLLSTFLRRCRYLLGWHSNTGSPGLWSDRQLPPLGIWGIQFHPETFF